MGNIMRRHSAPPASPPTSPPTSPTSLPTSPPVLRNASINLRTTSPANYKPHYLHGTHEDYPLAAQYAGESRSPVDTRVYKAICKAAFKRKGDWDDDRCDAPIYQSPRKQTTAELKQRLTLTTTWDRTTPGCKAFAVPHSTAKPPKVFPSSATISTPGTAFDVWVSGCNWEGRKINHGNKAPKLTNARCECGMRICAHLNQYDVSFPCTACEGRICEDCWLARNRA